MTNLEKLMRAFLEHENDYERRSVAGDCACRIFGCEDCPVANDKDRKQPCVIRLGKWAIKEATE